MTLISLWQFHVWMRKLWSMLWTLFRPCLVDSKACKESMPGLRAEQLEHTELREAQLRTPVLGERRQCGPKQVALDQFKPLTHNTLAALKPFIHRASSVLRSLRSCPLLFRSFHCGASLPRSVHPPSSSVYCGGGLNQTVQCLSSTLGPLCCVTKALRAAHFKICQHKVMLWTLRGTEQLLILLKGCAGEGLVSGAHPDGSLSHSSQSVRPLSLKEGFSDCARAPLREIYIHHSEANHCLL